LNEGRAERIAAGNQCWECKGVCFSGKRGGDFNLVLYFDAKKGDGHCSGTGGTGVVAPVKKGQIAVCCPAER